MTPDEMKRVTHAAFTEQLCDWVDGMQQRKADPELAYTALVLYVGHALSGAAKEFGFDPAEIAERSAEVIADTMVEMSEHEETMQ